MSFLTSEADGARLVSEMTSQGGEADDASAADIQEMFDINLKSVVLGTQLAFRAMKQRPAGSPSAAIVTLSSVAGLIGSPNSTLYNLSKGGGKRFTKGTAMEAASLGRIGRAEEVARGFVYLPSDDASFMTGSELVVDGGMTARSAQPAQPITSPASASPRSNPARPHRAQSPHQTRQSPPA